MNHANIEIEPTLAATRQVNVSKNKIFASKPGKTLNPFTSNEVQSGTNPERTRNCPELPGIARNSPESARKTKE